MPDDLPQKMLAGFDLIRLAVAEMRASGLSDTAIFAEPGACPRGRAAAVMDLALAWSTAGIAAFVAGWALAQRRRLLRKAGRLTAGIEARDDCIATLEADARWQADDAEWPAGGA